MSTLTLILSILVLFRIKANNKAREMRDIDAEPAGLNQKCNCRKSRFGET
jgi:hypothetical protein